METIGRNLRYWLSTDANESITAGKKVEIIIGNISLNLRNIDKIRYEIRN